MIKVNVIAVGKVKEEYFSKAILEYQKRLSKFCSFNLIEVKEENVGGESFNEIEKALSLEANEILKRCRGEVFASCIEGELISSQDLAKIVKSAVDNGEELTFVIGSSHGLSGEVKKRAKKKISFSKMTFPHTMFRVMLVEQIYRAFSIIHGAPYHK